MLVTTRNHTKIYWCYSKSAAANIRIYYPAGGLYQPVGKEGIAHLAEHILATPNSAVDGKYPSKYLINVNAQTWQTYISFTGDCMEPTHFDKLVELVARKIHDTPINRETLEREALAIRRELSNSGCNYPEMNQVLLHNYLGMDDTFTKAFGLVEGDTATLADRVSVHDLLAYREKYLSSPTAILIIGGIRPTTKRIEYIEKLFCKNTTEPPKPVRIRNHLPEKGTEIIDTLRQGDSSFKYLGYGWVSEISTKKQFVEWQLFTNALADPTLGLYKLLREQERLVYDFQGDQEIVAGQYLLFSLHTSTDKENVARVKQIVLKYLQNKAAILKDIEQNLREDKATLDSIYDGTNNTLDWQSYLLQADVSLDEYKKYVSTAEVDAIYDTCIALFDPTKMSVLYS